MNMARTTGRTLGWALLVGVVALMGGCSEELGPVPMPVARVRGIVTEGDRPVSGGWIEFIPVDGTIGNLRSAPLRRDGQFDTDGVAIGTNAIRLVHASIATRPFQGRFGAFTSPIRRQITAGSSAAIRIDLVEEAARDRAARARAAAGASPPTGEGP